METHRSPDVSPPDNSVFSVLMSVNVILSFDPSCPVFAMFAVLDESDAIAAASALIFASVAAIDGPVSSGSSSL